eukprot:6825717-Alexandrium_andersonii.AAC.1
MSASLVGSEMCIRDSLVLRVRVVAVAGHCHCLRCRRRRIVGLRVGLAGVVALLLAVSAGVVVVSAGV